MRYAPRLVHLKIGETFLLDTASKGSLENLYLKHVDLAPLKPNEITLDVKATGLNFRDVPNAMGLYPGDLGPMGCECAGTVTAIGENVKHLKVGDNVLGLGYGLFTNKTNVLSTFFVQKPPNLSFEISRQRIIFLFLKKVILELLKLLNSLDSKKMMLQKQQAFLPILFDMMNECLKSLRIG